MLHSCSMCEGCLLWQAGPCRMLHGGCQGFCTCHFVWSLVRSLLGLFVWRFCTVLYVLVCAL